MVQYRKEEGCQVVEMECSALAACAKFRKEQSEAQKKLDDIIAENQKLQSETMDLRLKNSELRLEYYENVDKLTDKQKEIEVAKKEADKWMMISDTAKLQTERAEFELEEAERLKKELLGAVVEHAGVDVEAINGVDAKSHNLLSIFWT